MLKLRIKVFFQIGENAIKKKNFSKNSYNYIKWRKNYL